MAAFAAIFVTLVLRNTGADDNLPYPRIIILGATGKNQLHCLCTRYNMMATMINGGKNQFVWFTAVSAELDQIGHFSQKKVEFRGVEVRFSGTHLSGGKHAGTC